MATFTLNDRLPDPTFLVNDGGGIDATTGAKGPGFASVKVTARDPREVSKTKSNRGVIRSSGEHEWSISITYNPMLRDEFDVVDTFLQSRGKKPFFVVLPQYAQPKDPAFRTFVAGRTFVATSATAAGSSKLTVNRSDNAVFTSTPKPGDFINITDPADINHLKAYKVLGVETNALYEVGSTQPATNQVRLRLQPPLTRFVNGGAMVNFVNPKFRVLQKGDTVEYDLNSDNLYQFGVQLEEILP